MILQIAKSPINALPYPAPTGTTIDGCTPAGGQS
jgi:hypothetical protein